MPQHTDPKPTLWNIAGIRPFWFVLVLVIALVIFLGWNWGTKQYGAQQQGHLLAQAKAAEAKGDYRSSLLSLRRVLQLEPDNVEAVRMLALQADRFNSPTALQWMQRLADLEPNNQTNLVLWAKCAMRQNELMVADQVLQRFPKDQRETLTYHRLAGAFAIHIRKYQAAEFHFGKALKLNPSSPHEQLNLATIRLLSAKPEIVNESRATLEKLMTNPDLGKEAAQALLTDHIRQKNTTQQLELAKKITQMPGSRFTDQLTYLDLLRRNEDSRFTTELTATKQLALQNIQNASELVAWMNAREQVQDAYTWVTSLPEKDRVTPALALSMAESQIKLKKWEELYNSTAKADWQELDFLRLAFLARAQREMNLWGTSRSSWRQAVAGAGIDAYNRSLLAKIAQGWAWNAEAEEIWLVLSRNDTGRIPALRALHKIYMDTGDSRRLLKVTESIAQLVPDDPIIKNNYAMLSLLLGQNLPKAREVARSNFEKHPNDPAAISTYAFAQREEGKLPEALALMEKLPQDVKKIPGIAAYLGIMLAESGRGKEARPYLELGAKAEGLLPEEKELLKTATAKAAK